MRLYETPSFVLMTVFYYFFCLREDWPSDGQRKDEQMTQQNSVKFGFSLRFEQIKKNLPSRCFETPRMICEVQERIFNLS